MKIDKEKFIKKLPLLNKTTIIEVLNDCEIKSNEFRTEITISDIFKGTWEDLRNEIGLENYDLEEYCKKYKYKWSIECLIVKKN